MKNLLLITFLSLLLGCQSGESEEELCPGAENPALPCGDPVTVNLMGNEYIQESISETSLTGQISIEIKDVGPEQGVEFKQAKMAKVCDNCNGVTEFEFDGNAVDVSFLFSGDIALDSSLNELKERFIASEIKLYFPDISDTKGKIHYSNISIDALDTTLPDGHLSFSSYTNGILKGEIEGLILEIIECEEGEFPVSGCTKFNNSNVEYSIKFEFLMGE